MTTYTVKLPEGLSLSIELGDQPVKWKINHPDADSTAFEYNGTTVHTEISSGLAWKKLDLASSAIEISSKRFGARGPMLFLEEPPPKGDRHKP